jgi:DNA-binding CsgD family transcriptional regulator
MPSTMEDRAGLYGSRVVMLAPPSESVEAFARALRTEGGFTCKLLPPNVSLGELERFAGARVVLAVPEALSLLQQLGVRRLLRWCYLFLLLDRERLLGASDTLDLVDGVIFYDGVAARADILDMAMEGVVVMPGYLTADFSLDDIRKAQLASLKPVELRVLQCLGEGLPNYVIGERLEIGEPKVKSAVRSLMVKLYFPNRTHAAIFAERASTQVAATLVRLRRQDGAHPRGEDAARSIG